MLDNWIKVPVPFMAGLATKAATAVVPPDRLAICENGVFTKQGTLSKRAGYAAVPDYTATGTVDGSKRGLFAASQKGTLATTRKLYNRVGGLWNERGRYLPVTYRAEEVAHANKNQTASDSATANGVTAVVWKYAADSLYFQLFSAADGEPLCAVQPLATATANYPSALAVGSNLLLFYVNTGGNDLKCRVIRTADIAGSLATATTVTTRTDLTADRLYSVCEGPAGVGFVAWEGDNSAGINGIGVATLDEFGSAASVTQVSTDATVLNPAVAYNSRTTTICVAWALTAGTVKFRQGVSAALGAATDTTVTTSGRIAVAPTVDDTNNAAGNHFCIAAETLGASDDLNRVTLVKSGSLAATVVLHAHLGSRGFTMSEQGCFVLAHESRTNLQNAYYLYNDAGYCMGAFEQGTALDRSADPELPGLSGGISLTLGFQRKLDVDDFKAQYTHSGIRLHRFNQSGRVAAAQLGNTTYLSGCQTWAYDGNQPVEAGFHMAPDVQTSDIVENAAGANLQIGQYNYRFYYEWYNARGERCRSQFMQRSLNVTVAGSHAVISIPTLRHTLKSAVCGREAEVSIVVYRSLLNDSSVYFRVSSPDPTTAGATNGYIPNSFTADSVSFTDDAADATIQDNERDMGSVLNLINAPVPGAEVLYATQDRLYMAGGAISRGNVIPSKLHSPGEMLELALENEARPCTDDIVELHSINETIVVFSERQAFAMSGPGFDNTGGGQGFAAGRVTSDVGCTAPGSVVMIPGGLLFYSAKGWYGMDQSFNVEYVGSDVEKFNGLTVKAAHVVPDTNHVVLLTSDGDTLMFDYFYGQWGTFTNHRGLDACVAGDDYMYLRSDGVVYVRTPGVHTDNGSPIIRKFRTGRFAGDEKQGQLLLRRIGVLGEYKSPHGLAVRFFYDRDEFWTQERIIDVTDVMNLSTWGSSSTWGSDPFWGGYGGSDYRFVLRPKRTKCAQIALEFEDIITEQAGASFELTELLFEVQPMDVGIQNTSAARKA